MKRCSLIVGVIAFLTLLGWTAAATAGLPGDGLLAQEDGKDRVQPDAKDRRWKDRRWQDLPDPDDEDFPPPPQLDLTEDEAMELFGLPTLSWGYFGGAVALVLGFFFVLKLKERY